MKRSTEKRLLKIVGISSIGGGLEMYDFVTYAFFAPVIGKLFFPKGNEFIELLSAFAVFAIGYFMRPIGALVFGHYGDTVGRKKTLLITILIMAIATTLMGCLPSYQHIGITATFLLIFLRLLQGLAVGGDFPGAITFVAEHVDASRRGLDCSWIFTGINFGFTLAAVVSTLITIQLTPEQIESFGWRIGFWLGLILAGVGYYLRTQLAETPTFIRLQILNHIRRFPVIDVFKREFSALLKGLGIVCLGAVVIGHMLYMPSYLHVVAKLSLSQALLFNTLGMLLWTSLILLMGYLSDILGRKITMGFSAVTLILFSYPLFHLISTGQIRWIILGLLGFAIFMSGIIGAFASALSEIFTTPVRNSGIGVAYNVGFALFCSLTPLIATTLVHQYGPLAPSYWEIAAATITLITLVFLKETANTDLS